METTNKPYFGGNDGDTYYKNGKIWELAKRNNEKEKVVTRTVKKHVERVGLL